MAARDSLPVLIGTRRYHTVLEGVQWRPLQSIRQQVDFGTEPSEATLDNRGIWKRAQDDFVLGAGQRLFDQREENERRSFRASVGLDVFTTRGKVCTLAAADNCDTVGDGDDGVMFGSPSGLYAASGTGLKFSATPKSGMTACSGTAGDINSIDMWGTTVYVATASGIYSAADGVTTFSSFSTQDTDCMVTAMGRMIVGHDHQLFEVDNAGTATAFYDYPANTFKWKGLVGAPNGVYAWGNHNGRSEVYLITVVDATGEMNAPYPVMQTLDGETINAMVFYGGVMWLATSLGVRLAQINGSGFLTFGPLIDEMGGVNDICGYGRFVYFTWSSYTDPSGTAQSGLGILNPEYFTKPLLPAYATYTMNGFTPTVRACAAYNGEIYYGSDTTSALQVIGPSDTQYVTSAKLWSGGISFGTSERKAWLGADGYWDSLPTNATVTISLLDGIGGAATAVVTNTTNGSTTDSAELSTAPEREESEILVTLSTTDATEQVCFRRWAVRAQPLPFRAEEITIPITMAGTVISDQGIEQVFDIYEEFTYLRGLMRDRSRVPFQLGFDAASETVIVDYVGIVPDEGMSRLVEWGHTPGPNYWPNGWWAVKLITVKAG